MLRNQLQGPWWSGTRAAPRIAPGKPLSWIVPKELAPQTLGPPDVQAAFFSSDATKLGITAGAGTAASWCSRKTAPGIHYGVIEIHPNAPGMMPRW